MLRTRDKFVLLAASGALVAGTWCFYAVPAAVELAELRSAKLAKARAADGDMSIAREVYALEQRKVRDEAARKRLESLFRSTPGSYHAFNRFAGDLAKRGYPPPVFERVPSDSAGVALAPAAVLDLECFRVRFECRFRDCVELLEAWQGPDSALRIQSLDVRAMPGREGLVAVEIGCELPRLEERASAAPREVPKS